MATVSNHAVEQLAINVGGKLSGVGGVTAVGSGIAGKAAETSPVITETVITLADIGVVVGITVALLGYLTQLFFHIRRDRREVRHEEREEHIEEMFEENQADRKAKREDADCDP